MAEQGQCGGRGAEAAHGIGRHAGEASAERRIPRPGHRATERRAIAERIVGSERHLPAAGDEQRGAEQPDQRAGEVPPAQPFTGQQAGKDDDEQRPEIADQADLDGGRVAQREEVEKMIEEQAADADQPRRRRLSELDDDGVAADQPFGEREGGGGREGHRDELERRHATGTGRQQRERRPQHDRNGANQGCLAGAAARRRRRRSGPDRQDGAAAQRTAGATALNTYAARH
jgi:hypothetical protein